MRDYTGLALPEGFDRNNLLRVIDFLANKTGEEGVERAVLVDHEGYIKWGSQGNERQVQAFPFERMGADNSGFMMLHSHPTPAELSSSDIEAHKTFGAAAIAAVSRDGSVSWTHGFKPEVTYPQFQLARMLAMSVVRTAADNAYFDRDVLPPDSVIARVNHKEMKVFRNLLKDYTGFYKDELKSMLKKEGVEL